MTEETIRNRLGDRIVACCPDADEAPQRVREIYNTAVEFFGEDMVDLQKTTIKEIWQYGLNSCKYRTLIERLGIQYSNAPSVGNSHENWITAISSEDMLATIEGLITTEKLLNTELPLYTILVHFHDITVSNEQDESVKIEDIYAAVPVTPLGHYTECMLWLRTTVSKTHWKAGYRHSHLNSGRGKGWMRPCLGSGPIRMTMENLRETYDLSFWSLLWLELDRCIRVESLNGGPYFRMSDITADRQATQIYNNFDFYNFSSIGLTYQKLLDKLAKRVLQSGGLQYSYTEGAVHIATSYLDFTVLASNCLLEYFHSLTENEANHIADRLMSNSHLIHAQIKSTGEIVSYGSLKHFLINTGSDIDISASGAGFSFRGKEVPFSVVEDTTPEEEQIFYELIGPRFAACLLKKITIIANYVYARKHSNSKIRTDKK